MARRRRRGANRSRVDARRRRRHRASQGRVGARRRAGGGGASRRVGIPPAAGWVRFWRSASWAEPAAAGAKEIGIEADSINDAAEEIIGFLKGPNTGDVIYFHGWDGLGASAVLRAVVERLTRPSSASASTAEGQGGGTRMEEVGVDKVIHIDCSEWRNMRALQRAIAEELKLPQRVFAIFDEQDEEDDYNGVEQGSRGVIPSVKEALYNELSSCRFLVVFHNGSCSYIDLWECGVPITGFMNKKVLWTTSQGRFHIRPEQGMTEESAGSSDVAIHMEADLDDKAIALDFLRRLLHIEAEEVAGLCPGHKNSMSPKVVLGCLLYRALRHEEYGIDWATHAANYWVCDGGILPVSGEDVIINGGASAWDTCDALHRNMNLEFDKGDAECLSEILLLSGEEWRRTSNRWVSATHQKFETEISVPPQATSFFYTATGRASASTTDDGKNAAVVATVMLKLEDSMFGHSDDGSNLQVLHLCYCTFSFSSPPFRRCRKLRFLLLHHCKNKDGAPVAAAAETSAANQDHLGSSAACCFQKSLWVLELSHTEWHWLLSEETLAQMDELRELHLKGVGFIKRLTNKCYGKNSQSSTLLLPNLTKLRLILETGVEDDIDEVDLSCSSILNTIQIINNAATSTKVERISLRGCTQMKNLHLMGPFLEVVELDLSGTQIETLDLLTTARDDYMRIRRLFLLGCEKLRAILWPQDKWIDLDVVLIDTTNHAEWSDMEGNSSKHEDHRPRNIICVRDARLFRSLQLVRISVGVCVQISSTRASQGINSSTRGDRGQQLTRRHANLYNTDHGIISTFKKSSEASGMTWWMWPCPRIPTEPEGSHCYIGIQDQPPTELLQQSTIQENRATTLPAFVSWDARTLHLHDSLSITSIPGPIPPTIQSRYYISWPDLMWCRLERCPNMEGSVFTAPPKDWDFYIFIYLETFWASQLPKARYIWDWSETGFRPQYDSFKDLVFLHLDCCPRLVHVLPLYDLNSKGCQSLETLEIVRCGELREVFPSDASESQQQGQPRKFPKLKRVHLYDLPKLQRICGRRMLAPNLETVKVKGCWGLKRLPAVGRRPRPAKEEEEEEEEAQALPEVDCEKDWWDSLEWDGEDAGHLPSHYRKRHSAYYKETRLRSSVLSYVFAYVFVTTVSSSGFQGNGACEPAAFISDFT
ncbi:hypothetical protein U9M48_030983 [Paspalum notatum var. saurae]|uniref:Disease resistance protein At4g27190-like leucine-rich repeats domain-containing protein n=1 Tax=Paspalum notatum var. saurae TaxID=547442 RepID=A0AAQ3U4T2_PASNO